MVVGERFTAWAMCPRCRAVAVHYMRPPNPQPELHESATDMIDVHSFGGGIVRSYVHGGNDETGFEVVRQCQRCGYEWGQT